MSYSSSDEDEEGIFALHDAAEAGDATALAELLQGRLQQLEAIQSAEQVLQSLDDNGPALPDDDPEVQARDYNECTPLHLAILSGSVPCLELLIQARASIKAECDGCPPLHMAVCIATHAHQQAAAEQMVAVLLQAGADPYKRDDMGRTALHWAAALGLDEVCSALLDATSAAADAGGVAAMDEGEQAPPSLLELQDNFDDTALHLAARFCHASTVQLLLKGPGAAAASAKNKAGHVPLQLAATHNAPVEAVTALLDDAPATAIAVDKKGFTAADLAQRRGHAALATLLQAHASKQGSSTAAASSVVQMPPTAEASTSGTLIVAPAECDRHRTCPHPFIRGMGEPPPENVDRLSVLVAPGRGVLHGSEFEALAWERSAPAAAIADVLRVHDWPYVRRLQEECASVPDEPLAIGRLDADTAVSRESFKAALVAAGAVCMAVDRVLAGKARNAFCAVRPPGHHAGPWGIAPSAKDPTGSHGFCLLNNVAIGAAYAMNIYRHAGLQRVALLDFDVHHGNGTEACVSNTTPKTVRFAFSNALSDGLVVHHTYSPWRDVDDDKNVFFASVQGYGRKAPSTDAFVYPGSGATFDTAAMKGANRQQQQEATGSGGQGPAANGTDTAQPPPIEEDPDGEFAAAPPPDASPPDGPRIINVGIPGPGFHPLLWRRAWRDKILPALAKFDPDLILISAGFDAHRKDDINFRYVGVTEADYEWLTEQIVQVANRCCQGRVVSVLEGGYNLHGGVVSAFARSVAAHVRALAEPHSQAWDPLEGKIERELERKRREEKAAKAAARAAAIAAAEMRQAMASASAGAALDEATRASGVTADAGLAALAAGASASTAAAASGDGAIGQQQAVAAASAPTAAASPVDAGRAKRRRTGAPVDYVALNAQMEAEAAGTAGSTAGQLAGQGGGAAAQ